jgi:hypothetical protein
MALGRFRRELAPPNLEPVDAGTKCRADESPAKAATTIVNPIARP